MLLLGLPRPRARGWAAHVLDGFEVCRLDDQGVPFPAPAWVAFPLLHLCVGMWLVDRDDPDVVDHLAVNRDVAGRLQNQRAVVVLGGHHHAEHAARDAPVARFHIPGFVVQLRHGHGHRLPGVGGGCRNTAVRWVHDDRRLTDIVRGLPVPVEPVGAVATDPARVLLVPLPLRPRDAPFAARRRPLLQFLRRELFPGEFLRQFERGEYRSRVVPHAGDIGLAIRQQLGRIP